MQAAVFPLSFKPALKMTCLNVFDPLFQLHKFAGYSNLTTILVQFDDIYFNFAYLLLRLMGRLNCFVAFSLTILKSSHWKYETPLLNGEAELP